VIRDDGYGNLDIVSKDENTGVVNLVYPKIGRVDYKKGVVSVNTLFSPETTSIFFTITAEPQNLDIFVEENKILRVSRGYSDSIRVSVQSQTSRTETLKA
jgi:hypothetical protein